MAKVDQLRACIFAMLGCGGLGILPAQAQQVETLEQAVQSAIKHDPWLQGNSLRQQATLSKAQAADALPDPTVSLGIANLPVDSWSLGSEPMTQLKVGVSQMFPRGESLSIQQQQLQVQAQLFPLLKKQRLASIEAQVSQLWLDAYLAQTSLALIERDQGLFEQLIEVTRAGYATALGNVSQQDVIRAQLELVQLQDRILVQQNQLDQAMAKLKAWLPDIQQIPQSRPQITLSPNIEYPANHQQIAMILARHPSIRAFDIQQQVAEKDVALAEQKYQPQWGVSASYAYRDDAPNGDSRADFFSVGVSFDVPLFSRSRQDQNVAASIASAAAVKTDKLLQIQTMLSAVDKEFRNLKRLRERRALYVNGLLEQVHEQAEASLSAYTNDDGDFAEVIRARIAELNAKLAALKIEVDALKTVSRLNYYFSPIDLAKLETEHAQ